MKSFVSTDDSGSLTKTIHLLELFVFRDSTTSTWDHPLRVRPVLQTLNGHHTTFHWSYPSPVSSPPSPRVRPPSTVSPRGTPESLLLEDPFRTSHSPKRFTQRPLLIRSSPLPGVFRRQSSLGLYKCPVVPPLPVAVPYPTPPPVSTQRIPKDPERR